MKSRKISHVILLICIMLTLSASQAVAEDKDYYTWVPSSGWVYAANGSAYPDTVYLYHDFEWSSESRLSGLKSDYNETLEMDIVFYDYDDSAYAYDWYNWDYNNSNAYRGTYWETNQPWPYWDTLASELDPERSFTIGCSDANLYQANTLYYWWGYGTKKSNGSMAKVVAQRGNRQPDYVLGDTWAVFSEQHKILVEFRDWYVPGSKSYTY